MKINYQQPQTEIFGVYENPIMQETLSTTITDNPATEIPLSNEGFLDDLDIGFVETPDSSFWDKL